MRPITKYAIVSLLLLFNASHISADEKFIDIGTRRELFVDDHLIDTMAGAIELKLHEPTPREVALRFDQPWEGNTSGYPTVIYDGILYRMFYKGHRLVWDSGVIKMANSPVVCYAESLDGIHWHRPELGLVKWQGKDREKLTTPTSNNIIWGGSPYSGTFVPFDDQNPNCMPEERFKAIGGNHLVGLHLFTSSDGKQWTKKEQPIFKEGALDSMNTIFWDQIRQRYTLYFRTRRDGRRDIDVVHSTDLSEWTESQTLVYGNSPSQGMYTNGIIPYYRAPHIFLGFPTRYTARKGTDKLRNLPPIALRKELGDVYERIATDLTDGLFMSSRNGTAFVRWDEAFVRPGQENDQRPENWMYGDNYQSYGLFPTKDEKGNQEISFLVSHSYWQEYKSYVRRYTIRPDGFVSLNAKYKGGELTTKPFTFSGSVLNLNYATSAAGSIRLELQDSEGNPLPGYSLDDCEELIGNTLSQPVHWKGGALDQFAGTPVRLRRPLFFQVW